MRKNNIQFENILLQEAPVRHLQVSHQRARISQSYLFVGGEGVGRVRTALAFSALLQCLQPVQIPGSGLFDACGTCDSCRRIERLAHPDLQLIKPEGNDIRISQARAIQERAMLKPTLGKWQIFILDPAEKLNIASANSMLKILEEAPSYVLFILISKSTHGVLPTILSRCELVRFNTPPHEEARKALQDLYKLDATSAQLCYSLSEGRFGTALQIAENIEAIGLSQGIRASQVDYLNAIEAEAFALQNQFEQAKSIEEALRLAGQAQHGLHISQKMALKSFCHSLFVNTGLPYGFPIMFADALLETIETGVRGLKKSFDGLLTELKKSYSAATFKEVEAQLESAVGRWGEAQLEDLLQCLSNFYGDALLVSCETKESLILNLNYKEDIITVARVEGVSLLRARIELIERASFMLRRHVQPSLILENLIMQIGGAEA
jgi:DNA polymerase III delta' subunit